MPMSLRRKAFMLFAASSALALVFSASPVFAQNYGYDDDNGYVVPAPGTEEVIVTAPRYHEPQRGHLGGDIVDVSYSRTVRADDLDLNTRWGRHELFDRVRVTAQTLCNRLDRFYPVGVEDSSYSGGNDSRACVHDAVARAMDSVEVANRDGRY